MAQRLKDLVIFGERAPKITEGVREIKFFRVTVPKDSHKIVRNGSFAYDGFSDTEQHLDFLEEKKAKACVSRYSRTIKEHRSSGQLIGQKEGVSHPLDEVLLERFSFRESSGITGQLWALHRTAVEMMMPPSVKNQRHSGYYFDVREDFSHEIGYVVLDALLEYVKEHKRAPDFLKLYRDSVIDPGPLNAVRRHKAKRYRTQQWDSTHFLNKALPKKPRVKRLVITEHVEEKNLFFVGDAFFLHRDEAQDHQYQINKSLHDASIRAAKSFGLKQALQIRCHPAIYFLMENYEINEVISASEAFTHSIVDDVVTAQRRRQLSTAEYNNLRDFARFRFAEALCQKLEDDDSVKDLPLDMVSHMVDTTLIREEVEDSVEDHVQNKSKHNMYLAPIFGQLEGGGLVYYRSSDGRKDAFRKLPAYVHPAWR